LDIVPVNHEGFVIGFVGNMKKIRPGWKEMCFAIAAERPDIRFLVVGENVTFTSDGIFTFTGKVDDVAPCLAEMDVFGYPLRIDHYGTCEQVIGEAMAAGLPVVCVDHPCERYILNHLGLLAKNGHEYISLINLLYEHPEIREAMGRQSRVHAKDVYDIEYMIHQWNNVFAEIMKQPKKTREPL